MLSVQQLEPSRSPNVWAELQLTEVLLPKGRLGRVPGAKRRSFLRDKLYVPGVSLSQVGETHTRRSEQAVRKSD